MLQSAGGIAVCECVLGHGHIATANEAGEKPDIKKLQIQLTGFLDKDTAKFCKELWTLCLSAQTSPQGVPKELLEAKKLELIQEKVHMSCPGILATQAHVSIR